MLIKKMEKQKKIYKICDFKGCGCEISFLPFTRCEMCGKEYCIDHGSYEIENSKIFWNLCEYCFDYIENNKDIFDLENKIYDIDKKISSLDEEKEKIFVSIQKKCLSNYKEQIKNEKEKDELF